MKISQTRMAALLNLSHQQIQKYESGASQIFLSRLLQFAQILNVAPRYFYEGVDLSVVGARIDHDIIDQSRTRVLNILLVDHNPGDILLFERALQSFRGNATLHGASDAAKAMKLVRGGLTPDIVIIDVDLPKDGGCQLMKDLKSGSQTSSAPIVALTHSSSRKTMLEAYRLGAAGFISKSPDPAEYRESMRHFLSYWLKTVVLP